MATGDEIAADALRYIGRPYVWGGWDCSGMVSHVLSADLGLPIPGYPAAGFTGPPPHGPVVSDYIAWAGARTIPGPPAAGDLVCFGPDVHIGIALSATMMVSALNPQLGTQRTPIGVTAPGQVIYRRVTGTTAGRGRGRARAAAAPGSSAALAVLGRMLLVVGLGAAAVVVVAGVAVFAVGAVTAGALGGRQRQVTRAR